MDTRTEECTRARNSKSKSQPWSTLVKPWVITSSNKLIGANPHGECHVGLEIAQGMGIFTLESLSEKAQGVTITDCHAGNPCVHIYDPRVENYSLMIESLYDRDG
ncbi:hypothetical protein Tco_1099322 [Tanacetum coccineum]